MSATLTNLLVVLFFVLLGGFFSAAELALVSLREGQISRLGEDGGRRGRRVAKLTADPNRFLASVQVGVTLAGFVSAGFGAAQIAPELEPVFTSWGMSQAMAGTVAFILVTIVIAYLSLVLGELVPKRIALQRTEQVAMLAAGPVDVIARAFRPFIVALSVSTNALVRVLGIDPKESKEQISGEELRDLVAAHEALSTEERELIDEVFESANRELREVMVPRTEVDFLDASMPVFKAVAETATRPHSRYPVIRGSADDVVGFVHVRDLLAPDIKSRSIRLGDIARSTVAFPGTNGVLSTLTEMRRQRMHIAIVQDEYGGTAGIVTMEDLVEELIGDIRDEYDPVVRPEAARIRGEIVVDGLLNIEDFAEETGVIVPDGPFETIAGFVVAQLGRLPDIGDEVVAADHAFTVVELDGRRAARVRVKPVPAAVDATTAEGD